jgi:hypothetical protein
MFVKISMASAFFLMVLLMMGAPFASASESACAIAISATHSSISLEGSRRVVIAQNDQSSDSADSDSDSSDSDKEDKDDEDSDSGDTEQSAGNDQTDQNAQQQAPESDAGQVPLNAYPQPQVNPNQ